jgi:hypothetical protein
MRFRPSIRSMNTARADGRHGTLAEREGSASPTFAWPYDTLATRHPLPSATHHDRQGREWLPVKGSERLRSRQHPWPDPATLQIHAATQSNYRLRSPRAAGRQTKALVAQPPHKVGFCRTRSVFAARGGLPLTRSAGTCKEKQAAHEASRSLPKKPKTLEACKARQVETCSTSVSCGPAFWPV